MSQQQSTSSTDAEPTNLHWPLIVALGAFALIRPFLSILGLSEGGPGVPIVATALITVVWIAAVVIRCVQRPIITLTAAGGMYGVFVLVMMIVGDPSRVSQLGYAGPSIMITNLVWGGIAGFIAEGIRRLVD